MSGSNRGNTGTPVKDDIESVLRNLAKKARTPVGLYRRSFAALIRHFDAVAGCMKASLPTGSVDDVHRDEGPEGSLWDKPLQGVLLEVQRSQEPVHHVLKSGEIERLIMGVPMKGGMDSSTGALAIVARVPDLDQAKGYLFQLKSLAESIENRAADLAREIKGRVKGEDVDRAVARAASYGTLEEFAFAISNNLRAKTGSDQVSFGVRRGSKVKVLAISGIDDPNLRSSGTTLIQQAMEECLDRKETIIAQSDDLWAEGALSTGHRLHGRWRDACGGATVASLPLLDGDDSVAVVSLRRPVGEPLTGDEISKIERLVSPLGTGLRLLRQANQSLGSHLRTSAVRSIRWLGSPRSLVRKGIAIAAIVGMLWFIFGTSAYEIPAPASLSAKARRFHTAPYDGRLEEVLVRTGDSVEKGDLIVRMDTRHLVLQRDELRATVHSLDVQIRTAVGANEKAEALLMRARRDASYLKLKGVDHRISLAEIRATCDGYVIDGEIQLRRGQVVTQGDPLCIVAAKGSMILELSVSEEHAGSVAVGTPLLFASHARPEAPLRYRVERIRPFAEQREQSNVFIAEAVLEADQAADYIRIGMDGSAMIDAGRRPVWWLAFHRVIDRLHLKFWL